MFRTCLLSSAVLFAVSVSAVAQPFPPVGFPRQPFPPGGFPQQPFPQQPGQGSPLDGPWYFRGDPNQPCYIQTIPGPQGPMMVFTNEKGSQAYGRLAWGGRRVVVYDWNLTGAYYGNRIIWPNGDFWAR